MDADGVAAEVVFHSSQNGEPIPFIGRTDPASLSDDEDLRLAGAGLSIYNTWLASVCNHADGRLIGLAMLPVWDPEKAAIAVSEAAEMGLGGVDIPPMHDNLLPYDDPRWNPLWDACQRSRLSVWVHARAVEVRTLGLHRYALMEIEGAGWLARRIAHRLALAGVFQRYPELKLVLTEQSLGWWASTMRELDSSHHKYRLLLASQVPHPPSHYFRQNVFLSALLGPLELSDAIDGDYVGNLLWGRDFPHIEGSWRPAGMFDGVSMTRLALRYAFASFSPAIACQVLSSNPLNVCPMLDSTKLGKIAARIEAPTIGELQSPLEAIPQCSGSLAFRTIGPWS